MIVFFIIQMFINVMKNTISYKQMPSSFFTQNYIYRNSNYIFNNRGLNKHTMKKNNDYYYEVEPYDKELSLNKKLQKNIISFYEPKTENQKKYVDYLNNRNNSLIVAVGSAGSGKTLYACLKAIELLKTKQIKKIIITRPVVSVEEDIGFLPGTIESKMDPYMRPIFDIFTEFYSMSEWNDMIFSRVIEISPLAYMRGRTFKNSFIIADEMQNSSPNQMKMLLTRIGENSRMVLTGDLSQTDKIEYNGLKEFIDKLEKYPKKLLEKSNIQTVYLNHSDIQRHTLVENILNIYEYKKQSIKRMSKKKCFNETEPEPEQETNKKWENYENSAINIELNKNQTLNQSDIKHNDIYINRNIYIISKNVTELEKQKEKMNYKEMKEDCALIPKKDIPKVDLLNKYKTPNFKDWSREIGI